MPNPEVLSTREGYDIWADFYDQDDNPLVRIEEPIMENLIGSCAGRDVLDVGCGTGRWSAKLAAGGARVTAFDFSIGMLKRARAKPACNSVRFLVHDIACNLPFRSASFDRVACCLVLDHVADLVQLFREMGRVCRPDGFIAASTMHPALMLKGTQARFRDPVTGQEVRPRSEPHLICDYVNACLAAGLRIDHIGEYAVNEALAAACPRAVKYLGWPMLLVMKLRP